MALVPPRLRLQAPDNDAPSIRSAVNVPHLSLRPNTPRRLLIPTSRLTSPIQSTSVISPLSSRSPKPKTSTSKLIRSHRTQSLNISSLDDLSRLNPPYSAREWAHTSDLGISSASTPNGRYTTSSSGITVKEPQTWLQLHFPKFEVIEDEVELSEFQLHAVDKWVITRSRPIKTIVVSTPGQDKNKISVASLAPTATSSEEILRELELAVHSLKIDGARPKETSKGIIMVTSLPDFPPALTTVNIPGGNFRSIEEKLYLNINMLRMEISSRSGLSLDEPVDSTKEKFIQTYHFPDIILQQSQSLSATKHSHDRHLPHHHHTNSLSHTHSVSLLSKTVNHREKASHAKSSSRSSTLDAQSDPSELFRHTVLQLITYVQSALFIFGKFNVPEDEWDGVLCDATANGFHAFVIEMSTELGLEFGPRRLDPTFVAVLFSTIVVIRNKLHSLNYAVPKDPFLEPVEFLRALSQFQKSHNTDSNKGIKFVDTSTLPNAGQPTFLDVELMERINTMFATKFRPPERYELHRRIKHRLDDSIAMASSITGNLRVSNLIGSSNNTGSDDYPPGSVSAALTSGAGSKSNRGHSHAFSMHGVPGVGSLDSPTSDLEYFSKMVIVHGDPGSSSGGVESLRSLWLGKWHPVIKAREREKERKEKEKPRRSNVAEPEEESGSGREGKERGHFGRVKTKILGTGLGELALGKGRKNADVQSDPESSSAPLPSKLRTQLFSAQDPTNSARSSKRKQVTSLHGVAWTSPVPSTMPSPTLAPLSGPPSSLQVNDWSSNRKVSDPFSFASSKNHSPEAQGKEALHRRRPISIGSLREAFSSRSDPFMKWTKDSIGEGYRQGSRRRDIRDVFGIVTPISEGIRQLIPDTSDDDLDTDFPRLPNSCWWEKRRQKSFRHRYTSGRRYSFGDPSEYCGMPILSTQRMGIDVELCGQYFSLRTQSEELRQSAATLEALLQTANATGDELEQMLLHLTTETSVIDALMDTASSNAPNNVSSEVRQMTEFARRADYNVSQLEKQTADLENILARYRRRTDRCRYEARVAGGEDEVEFSSDIEVDEDREPPNASVVVDSGRSSAT